MISESARTLRRRLPASLEWLFGLGVSGTFAFFLAKGNWIGLALVAAALAAILVVVIAPFALVLTWIAGMPTVLVVADNILPDIPFLTPERALFLACVGMLVAGALTRAHPFAKAGPIEKAMALYLLVILVSWAWHAPGRPGSQIWQDTALLFDGYLMPFGAYLVARNTVWTPERRRLLLWLLVAGVGSWLVVAGLADELKLTDFFRSERYPAVHGVARAAGPFSNALAYGMVVGSLLVIALYLILETPRIEPRLLLLAVAAGLLLAVILSRGRAVWLSVPIVMAFLFLRSRRIRPLIAMVAILGGLAVLGAAPFFLDFQDLERRLTDITPIYDRIALYATALSMIVERPFFGFGFGDGTFQTFKAGHYHSWAGVSPQYAATPGLPHNEFLNATVMMGLVGLAAYLVLLLACWVVLERRVRAESEDAATASLAIYVQAVFIVLLVNNLFMDPTESSNYGLVLLFFMIGLVAHGPPRPKSPPRAEPL